MKCINRLHLEEEETEVEEEDFDPIKDVDLTHIIFLTSHLILNFIVLIIYYIYIYI